MLSGMSLMNLVFLILRVLSAANILYVIVMLAVALLKRGNFWLLIHRGIVIHACIYMVEFAVILSLFITERYSANYLVNLSDNLHISMGDTIVSLPATPVFILYIILCSLTKPRPIVTALFLVVSIFLQLLIALVAFAEQIQG